MYADWSLKWEWWDEQLIIVGSLITRNTLYGAIDGDDGCFDPGGKQIDCDIAQKYDLAYIRIASEDPDPNDVLNTNEYDDYSLIIKYDANLQANPPKGFR